MSDLELNEHAVYNVSKLEQDFVDDTQHNLQDEPLRVLGRQSCRLTPGPARRKTICMKIPMAPEMP